MLVPETTRKTRGLGFTPHVAQNTTNRRSAIDRRTTRHPGHIVSQRIRKRVEPFGWIKTIGAGRKLRYIGRQRNRAWFKIEVGIESGHPVSGRHLEPHPNHRPRRRTGLTGTKNGKIRPTNTHTENKNRSEATVAIATRTASRRRQ